MWGCLPDDLLRLDAGTYLLMLERLATEAEARKDT